MPACFLGMMEGNIIHLVGGGGVLLSPGFGLMSWSCRWFLIRWYHTVVLTFPRYIGLYIFVNMMG